MQLNINSINFFVSLVRLLTDNIMKTSLNYIYNQTGLAEYVVIPVEYWNYIKKIIKDKAKPNTQTENFNPKDYFGAISHLNLNIEDELINMRSEWKRDF